MKINKQKFIFIIWTTFHILLFCSLNVFFKKSMFGEGLSDGFYGQIYYVVNNSLDIFSLNIVHYFRLIAILPFYIGHILKFPEIYEPFIISLFFLPIFFTKFKNKYSYLSVLFIYCSYGVSFRMALSICSITYLYIFIQKKKITPILFIISLLLANLSSGTVLVYLLIFGYFFKSKIVKNKFIFAGIICIVFGFTFSVLHKLSFASDNLQQGSVLGLYISRSTLAVAIENNQTTKLYLYLFVLIVEICLILYLVSKIRVNKILVFFILGLFTIIFEGLAFLSFSYSISYFYWLYRKKSAFKIIKK